MNKSPVCVQGFCLLGADASSSQSYLAPSDDKILSVLVWGGALPLPDFHGENLCGKIAEGLVSKGFLAFFRWRKFDF